MNLLMQGKDRRRAWQKQCKNFPFARCGTMLAETAAAHGLATKRADKELNARGGRYGERPSIREVQYFRVMTQGDAPHHSACGSVTGQEANAINEWLGARNAWRRAR